jgi:citrate lyase subunit beta / citryl-CoA lyase
MDPLIAPARSWLFVPANRHERFAKAAAGGADRVILDLEDAVAPEAKAEAARGLLSAPIPEGLPVYVRVNAFGTRWFEDDLAVAARLPIAGVVLPKADSAKHVARAAAALPASHRLVPIAETADGVWNALEVARGPRVERLAFGAVDFHLDTGMSDDGDALAFVRGRLAVASRVARIAPPIDSVCLSIDDEARIADEGARARRFGFAGKLCIHPRQLAATNRAFRPRDDDLEWARALVAAFEARPAHDRAAFSFRGTMVDRPVLERARQLISLGGLHA